MLGPMQIQRHVLISLFLLPALGCAGAATPATTAAPAAPPASTEAPSPYADTYQQALDTAENPSPEKIFNGLTAITPETPKLEWREIDGRPHVRVASWVSTFEYYQSSLGKTYNTGKYDVWVSAAPFVKELCSDPAWRGDDLDLRLTQLLGLPPGNQKVGFVEFWVSPEDLFRPCPDNEITDTQCGLALPDDVTPEYRAWFNDLRAKQYFVAKDPAWPGWPWTQLGYTFDWHDLDNPVGVSEFVIANNANVVIEALTPTAAYCGAE